MNRARKFLAAAMAAGTLAVTALPLQEAVASSSPPVVENQMYAKKKGKLIAGGVATRVKITVRCNPDTHITDLNFTLYQVSEFGGIHTAYRNAGTRRIICDSERHTTSFLILGSGEAWRKGKALLRTDMYACDDYYYNCEQFNDLREIRLVN